MNLPLKSNDGRIPPLRVQSGRDAVGRRRSRDSIGRRQSRSALGRHRAAVRSALAKSAAART